MRENDGEVEARNVEKRANMTMAERLASLAEETEDAAREDQIILREGAEMAMGSQVTKRMADIAKQLRGKELTPEQQKVVDVYTGKSKNETLIVDRKDGKQSVVVRQGNETNAGTKHSVYRHYATHTGYITAGDILLIPKVLKEGKKTAGSKPNTYKYNFELEDGSVLVVTTQREGRKSEVFTNAYTNRKASNSILSRESIKESNTPKDAQVSSYDTFSESKDTTTIQENQINGVNFSLITPEMDATYLDAVERGDMETAP